MNEREPSPGTRTGRGGTGLYDGLQFALVVIGFWEGVIPVGAAVFGWTHRFWLALPLLLGTPAAIVTGTAVIVLAVAGIWWLDRAKRRGTVRRG